MVKEPIDHRSDLFSLGSLIFFMLTGHSPFRAETTMGVLNRIANDEPRSIREINADVPNWLETIVMCLLSKSAGGRYQTAEEVIEALRNGSRHDTASQGNVKSKASGTSPPNRIRRWLIAAGFGGLFALLSTIIVLELNKGTLTIECEADDVSVRIMKGDKIFRKLTVTQGQREDSERRQVRSLQGSNVQTI